MSLTHSCFLLPLRPLPSSFLILSLHLVLVSLYVSVYLCVYLLPYIAITIHLLGCDPVPSVTHDVSIVIADSTIASKNL